MEQNFLDRIAHPREFQAFARSMNLPKPYALGVLEALRLEGNLASLTNQQIAERIEWSADADALVAALVDTGWLYYDANGHRYVRDHWRDQESHAKFVDWLESDRE
jgi:hypothetical protein